MHEGLGGTDAMTTGHRVLVHVGTPKTGTSFVQDLLFQNRDSLARTGVLYPADRFDEHFLAALDLMDLEWGGLEAQAVGAWDRLAEKVRDWPGTVVVSHEILATASRQQVKRALDSFGNAEVHIVLSARDLVRQIPAEWQENIKHRRTIGYRSFLDKIADPRRRGRLASWFWGVQEVPDILDRWGATLPAEQVHLVTVPKPGAPRDLLWERFASVLGLDPTAYTADAFRANPSLGVPETAFVRRLNRQLNQGVLANHSYRELVRELLVHHTLSSRTGSPRLRLPDDVHAWAVRLSEEWVEELAKRGYDVVGTLEDLRPDTDASGVFADPDSPDPEQVSEVGVDAVVALLEEAARLREDRQRLVAERDALLGELDHTRGLVFRAKRRVVRAADDNRSVALALGGYRRLRGLISRSV